MPTHHTMLRGQYARIAGKTIGIAALATVLAGCCSEKDKDRVRDQIDRFNQQGTETCKRICDRATRDQCFLNLNQQLADLNGKYIDYLAACEAGDDDLAERILEGIRDIIKQGLTRGAGGAVSQLGVYNQTEVFSADESLAFHASSGVARVSGSTLLVGSPSNSLLQTPGASISVGNYGSIISIDPCQVLQRHQVLARMSDELDLAVVAVTEYIFTDGSATITSNGNSLAAEFTGDVALAFNPPANDGTRYAAIVGCTLRLRTPTGSFDVVFSSAAEQPETGLYLDAAGKGTLAMFAEITQIESAGRFMPTEAWIELPVEYDAATDQLTFTTGNNSIAGDALAPRAPFPAADRDNDVDVDTTDYALYLDEFASGASTADIDGDGVVTTRDLVLFEHYYDLEINR